MAMSTAFLNLSSQIVAYGDATSNANPSLKFVDWKRSQIAVPVDNPGSESLTLSPGTSNLIFDSSRTTLIDASTQFTLALSTLDSARYRFTHVAGTAPGLRTARVMSTSGIVLALTANLNGTLTVSAGSGTPFANVVAGDIAFIPGVSTGDADAGFDPLNEGWWIVLGRSDTVLTLMRDGDFTGVSESVTPGANNMLAYSVAGVQVDDRVDISAGFATSVFGNYQIVAITSTWFEVVSTSPLAPETAIPGVTGMAFYLNAQRYVRIEASQSCVIRINGDVSNCTRIAPFGAGGVGHYEKVGLTWSLAIINTSTVPAAVTIITAE